jgi:hypothetical protein
MTFMEASFGKRPDSKKNDADRSQYVPTTIFSLANVRSYKDETSIELSRINLIFGANSAGKSTLSKSIMALAELRDPRSFKDLVSARSRFLGPLRGNRVNLFEAALGSSMESLSYSGSSDALYCSVSVEDLAYSDISDFKVELRLRPSKTQPFISVKLLTDGVPLAEWSARDGTITPAGKTVVEYIRSELGIKKSTSESLLGSLEKMSASANSLSPESFTAADLVRDVLAEGLGESPRYTRDTAPAGEIKRMRSASSDVNRLIREMGSTIRVANPRAESEYQLFDEANGLVLGLDQVGSGTGQMVAVANRISRASTKSAEYKRFGSGRYPLALIQEPEAHLHPRKQADIGEVICRQAITHPMRLLIETHSDALLFRCLKLIRRGTIDHDAMRVIYVEQAQDGTSTARNLRIGEDGALVDPFPVGFLDWGLEDLLGQ